MIDLRSYWNPVPRNQKEKSAKTGDGFGRVPANPLNPGGDERPRPVAAFNIIDTPSGLGCFTAILTNISLLFLLLANLPN